MVFRKEAFQGYSFLGMYGVKTIAERFVRGEGKSLPIRAVFDREQTSGTFHFIPICPIEDAVRDGMDGLILACGVKAIPFVYARVKALCQENGIRIFDVYGHDLDVVFSCKLWDYSAADKADRDVLYREIERHDVISFDIFDTLLIRLVLQPSDAFTLVAKRARENGIRIPDVPPFKAARSIAEFRALDRKKHTLDQIYQELQTLYSWSDEECQKVRDIELQVEEQILRPRAAVVDAFQYAKKLGKRICLTTDMYLPESFLSRILSKYQVTGYQKMFISGYEGRGKSEGLHEFVKSQMGEGRYLHIGDNLQADGIYARYAGMDAYCLPNIAARWKLRHGDEVFLFQSHNSCAALGCALAQCFQNPFLSEEEQLEKIDPWKYAYLFVAPMVSAYVFYLLDCVQKQKYNAVLFGARDGWLIQKLYDWAVQQAGLQDAPPSKYLYISRKAGYRMSMQTQKDFIGYRKMMSVWPKEWEGRTEESILADGRQQKENFLRYLTKEEIDTKGKYLFFDLVSHGSVQYCLQKEIFPNITGCYLYWNYQGLEFFLSVLALYYERTFSEDSLASLDVAYIDENILSSPEPSVAGYDHEGNVCLAEEARSEEQLKWMEKAQRGILQYFKNYWNLFDGKDVKDYAQAARWLFFWRKALPQTTQRKVFATIHLFDDFIEEDAK